MTPINLLSGNETQDMSALKWIFCDFCVLARKLASPFGHPSSTYGYLRVRLTRAFRFELLATSPVSFSFVELQSKQLKVFSLFKISYHVLVWANARCMECMEPIINNVGEKLLTFAKATYCDRLLSPVSHVLEVDWLLRIEFFDPNVTPCYCKWSSSRNNFKAAIPHLKAVQSKYANYYMARQIRAFWLVLS